MTTIGVFALVTDDDARVLCVKHNYGDFHWGMPGGRLEPGENPIAAMERVVMEEAAVTIAVSGFVGAYAAPYRDDLVLVFRASVRECLPWRPSDEISAIGFFRADALPEPMSANHRLRYADAIGGLTGGFRAFSAPGEIHAACDFLS